MMDVDGVLEEGQQVKYCDNAIAVLLSVNISDIQEVTT